MAQCTLGAQNRKWLLMLLGRHGLSAKEDCKSVHTHEVPRIQNVRHVYEAT